MGMCAATRHELTGSATGQEATIVTAPGGADARPVHVLSPLRLDLLCHTNQKLLLEPQRDSKRVFDTQKKYTDGTIRYSFFVLWENHKITMTLLAMQTGVKQWMKNMTHL
jgi:hypothetical protein